MLIAGAVVTLFIVGLFLEMLSSSPKTEGQGHVDTESESSSTHPIGDIEAPALRS
jgi:hypothetical protein